MKIKIDLINTSEQLLSYNINLKLEKIFRLGSYLFILEDFEKSSSLINQLKEKNYQAFLFDNKIYLLLFSLVQLELLLKENFLSNYDEIYRELNLFLKKYIHSEEFNYSFKGKRLPEKSIMGILNLTDDSFYDGGKYINLNAAIKKIDEYIELGIDIIDLGAESTRPGSEPIDAETEISRILPVLKYLQDKDVIVSVDTYKSSVADECLKNGADIINDISGFDFDKQMPAVIKKYNAGIVLMHIKGTPKNMQDNPFYDDVVSEVYSELQRKVEIAEKTGINNIFIDPGIGFGKTLKNNYELLNKIEIFKFIGYPILIGTSRKSLIGKLLNQKPEERLIGSIVTNIFSYMNSASVFRVHDVKEFIEAKKIIDCCIEPKNIDRYV